MRQSRSLTATIPDAVVIPLVDARGDLEREVITVPTELVTKERREAPPSPRPSSTGSEERVARESALAYAKRTRRFKINAIAWALGTSVLTAVWVIAEWSANGAFERFGHEGNQGDWNPTLWALAIGLWGLVVGIMALRVYFERPGRVRRLRFHVAAWVLGMVMITPLNALIEWQDNGGFERLSRNGQPGSWDPWVLYIGGSWAFAIAALALIAYVGGPKSQRGSWDGRGRLRL